MKFLNSHTFAQIQMVAAMLLWSTIGMTRRFIEFPSTIISCVRGVVGVIFLFAVLFCLHKSFDWVGVKKNLYKLLLAGCFLGTNWAILFEAYQYTNVAVAELFYYTNPIFVILLSPFILKEKISFKQGLCIVLALCGMVLVSQIYQLNVGEEDGWGIFLAVVAALEVAGFILINKYIKEIGTYERAIVQLFAATLVLIPYIFYTQDFSGVNFEDTKSWFITLMVGVVHTGMAYFLYYNAFSKLKAQEICILGYTDPVMAIFWSTLVFGETLGIVQIIGAVLIVGSMMYVELRG